MRGAIVVLLAVLAALMLLFVATRWYEPQRQQAMLAQIREQTRSIERLEETLRALTSEAMAPIRAQQETSLAAPRSELGDSPELTVERDGVAALDRPFLLPYDGTHFDRDLLGGTLRRFGSTPPGLNDIVHNASDTGAINSLVNDALCARDIRDIELWRAALATEVLISDDWKRYVFTIRRGVRWQRPQLADEPGFEWLNRDVALTAHDFVFWLDMVRNPDVEAPAIQSYYQDIDSWRAIDDHTFEIIWTESNYTNISFSLGISPLPRHIYAFDEQGQAVSEDHIGILFNEHWFDRRRQLIGVGPYRMVGFEPDRHVHFARNARYWGATPHFERIEWDSAVKDPAAQLTAFKNGQVHSAGLTATQWKIQVLDGTERRFAPYDPQDPQCGWHGELGYHKVVQRVYSYIGWNQRRPLFSDLRVRQALSHAFPRQRVIDEVYHRLGRPQASVLHPDSPYHDPDLEPWPYDVGRARALLAEAGWRDSDGDGLLDREIDGRRQPFRFTLIYYANSPEWDALLAIYQAELRRLGIEMRLRSLEWSDLVKVYQNQDFDAVAGGWSLGGEVDFMQLWHSSEADKPNSSNHVGFKHPEADRLAMELRRSFVLADRIRIAREFERLIHQQQPYTFIRSVESAFVWQNGLHPAVDPALGLHGVTYGLEHYHPFAATAQLRWHFRPTAAR